MAKKTEEEKQKEKEQKQQEKEQKQQEKIDKMTEKKAFKYKKMEELSLDLNERLTIALQNGQDPLGQLSITQIVEDIETVNRLKGKDIAEQEIEGD